MRLYRYMSLENLWYFLDLVVGRRAHCAKWCELNDPLEGTYELFLDNVAVSRRPLLEGFLSENRDNWRIASFSATPTHLLLWSHYADGHRGVAVEVDIPDHEPALYQVLYSPFDCIFDDKTDTSMSYPEVFAGKTEEWAYEEEWRLITREEYFWMSDPCTRVLLGPQVPEEREVMLKRILPASVSLVRTHVNRSTMRVEPREP